MLLKDTSRLRGKMPKPLARVNQITRGCGCKSGCNKKYCECNQHCKPCDPDLCKCRGCENTKEAVGGKFTVIGTQHGRAKQWPCGPWDDVTGTGNPVVTFAPALGHDALCNLWAVPPTMTTFAPMKYETPHQTATEQKLPLGRHAVAVGMNHKPVGMVHDLEELLAFTELMRAHKRPRLDSSDASVPSVQFPNPKHNPNANTTSNTTLKQEILHPNPVQQQIPHPKLVKQESFNPNPVTVKQYFPKTLYPESPNPDLRDPKHFLSFIFSNPDLASKSLGFGTDLASKSLGFGSGTPSAFAACGSSRRKAKTK